MDVHTHVRTHGQEHAHSGHATEEHDLGFHPRSSQTDNYRNVHITVSQFGSSNDGQREPTRQFG